MAKSELRVSPLRLDRGDIDQMLSDLNGLERLQSMQLSLVRELRKKMEAAARSPAGRRTRKPSTRRR